MTAIEETTFQNLSLLQKNVDISITVYPNPTISLLHKEPANTIKAIELFDIYSRLLQSNLQGNSIGKMDLSEKAVGIYFVKITSEKESKVEKIVKK